MKVDRKLSRFNRTYLATFVCEGCGHEQEGTGENNDYWNLHDLPLMRCQRCGRDRMEIEEEK